MEHIIYVPLDERPCNAKYPLQLAAMTDIPLLSPPSELLGKKKQAAEADRLSDWIARQIPDTSRLIVSVDMLVYGGIVPSRLHHLSEDECMKRLGRLREWKQINPSLKIYAFNLIMRAPAYNGSDEEPDYYQYHGRNINRFGWLRDKQQYEPLTADEQQEWEAVQRDVPQEVLQDFLNRRKVNAKVNEETIKLVSEGIVDHLVIPLDDNAKYGFSPMEQRKLLFAAEELEVLDRVFIYPGADEIACTMFARVFCEMKHYVPSIFVRYSSTLGPTVIPKYEDRSLQESVKSHLTAAGAFMDDSSERCDAVLMVHSPPVSQHEVAETSDAYNGRHRSYYSEVHILEFAKAIEVYAKRGKLVALADVALCNGADHSFMRFLKKKGLLPSISAYAGWNTSGNSMGTVVAHAVIESYYRRPEAAGERSETQQAGSLIFYLARLLEDWGYQAIVRWDVAYNVVPALGGDYFTVGHIEEPVNEALKQKMERFAKEYLSELAPDLQLNHVHLPWKRMFEIGFDVELPHA
ncbi:DUF4127 family protein [Paenibacillus thermotolerans]|uniref:DUF4127 family protein n=1 Tax=Paenibacillus thermotolerans TaxID=3027807 RepID=UPI002367CBEB|nr:MULTISPECIES: DUF4127 family protein [unclassified Paenibacillus]